jgi:hypothetical protein
MTLHATWFVIETEVIVKVSFLKEGFEVGTHFENHGDVA